MKKIRKGTQAGDAAKVTALVAKLNRYRHEYYNLAAPSVPDAVYDHLFDELQELEKQTGIILSNSPTQTVGAVPVSSLKKVKHPIPLLSLDKTKQMEIAARQEFHAQMVSAVREEMQAQGMKLVGALLAGIGTAGVPAKKSEAEPAVTELPEACGELPEELNGVLDLIA